MTYLLRVRSVGFRIYQLYPLQRGKPCVSNKTIYLLNNGAYVFLKISIGSNMTVKCAHYSLMFSFL